MSHFLYLQPPHQTCQDLIFSFVQHNAILKSMLADQNHNDLVSTAAELPGNIVYGLSLLEPKFARYLKVLRNYV